MQFSIFLDNLMRLLLISNFVSISSLPRYRTPASCSLRIISAWFSLSKNCCLSSQLNIKFSLGTSLVQSLESHLIANLRVLVSKLKILQGFHTMFPSLVLHREKPACGYSNSSKLMSSLTNISRGKK